MEIGLFLPLAIAMLSGDAIAGEAQIGTLRGLLVVPVARTRLLATKYVALVLGAFIGVLVVAVAGLVAGGVLFGLHPVTTLSGTTLGLGVALGRLGLVVLYVTGFLAAQSGAPELDALKNPYTANVAALRKARDERAARARARSLAGDRDAHRFVSRGIRATGAAPLDSARGCGGYGARDGGKHDRFPCASSARGEPE